MTQYSNTGSIYKKYTLKNEIGFLSKLLNLSSSKIADRDYLDIMIHQDWLRMSSKFRLFVTERLCYKKAEFRNFQPMILRVKDRFAI